MKRKFPVVFVLYFFVSSITAAAQQKWVNVDSAFQPLPKNFHVFKCSDSLDGKPFIAYYATAKLKDRSLNFTADTSRDRRLTPLKFYEKNNQPLLVVNCTFFSYETNRSLNAVIKEGELVGFNTHTIPMKGKDTFQYRHPFVSAIGINRKRNADVAWLFTDSAGHKAYAVQNAITAFKDSAMAINYHIKKQTAVIPDNFNARYPFKKWKMTTAVGGGPALVQNGQIKISNNEELKFGGKAIDDKHPRTCMGYTKDGWLIVMVIQGRFPGIADGVTLTQEAKLLADVGCEEALNLDGGGSSCMLINGKETIKPSDKVERAVPAVFMVKKHR